MIPRLKQQYHEDVAVKLQEEFKVTNRMALPRLDKIVLSVGMGNQVEGTKLNARAKEQVDKDLAQISGQKAVFVRAKKSVSNFKVRAGYETGAMVTLRGDRMWEFLDRLIAFGIPRIKDFRGLSDRSFDGRGNYTFGINEQGVFPEIDMAHVNFIHGMHITIVFSKSTDDMSRAALRGMGFPFVHRDEKNN